MTDSGIGIPKNALKKLFNRFTQVDSSTTRNYGGTGVCVRARARVCVRACVYEHALCFETLVTDEFRVHGFGRKVFGLVVAGDFVKK